MKLDVFFGVVILAFLGSACSDDSSGGGSSGAAGAGGGSGGAATGGGGGSGLTSPCGDNPTAKVSFDIDGAGHSNEHIEFAPATIGQAREPGVYYASSDVTAMQVYQGPPDGQPLPPRVELYFMGNQPKTETLGTPTEGALNFDHVLVHVALKGDNGSEDFSCCNENTPPTYSGTITVSQFGAVGGHIVGTFEGDFDGEVTDLGGTSATFSNGVFDVTRCEDGS